MWTTACFVFRVDDIDDTTIIDCHYYLDNNKPILLSLKDKQWDNVTCKKVLVRSANGLGVVRGWAEIIVMVANNSIEMCMMEKCCAKCKCVLFMHRHADDVNKENAAQWNENCKCHEQICDCSCWLTCLYWIVLFWQQIMSIWSYLKIMLKISW